MANLRRPSSSKDKDVVGRFRPDGCCKKHPRHRQSPGVCSLCLQEKLTQVSSSSSFSASASSSRNKTTSIVNADGSSSSSSVSSLSSCYSSNSGSSCTNSPLHRLQRGRSGSSSISIFFLNGKHGLAKSQSVAVYPRRRENEGGVDVKKNSKKGGFWHKLLHSRSKRMKEKDINKLIHSRSVRERLRVGI